MPKVKQPQGSFARQRHLEHISLADSSPGMPAVLNEKITARRITNLRVTWRDLVTEPLPEEHYDLFYTLMTLHDIEDTAGLLRKLCALLGSPGDLCVADLDAEDGSFHGPGFNGHNGFDHGVLAAKAKSAGFRAVSFKTLFSMTKEDGSAQTKYPISLMLARK